MVIKDLTTNHNKFYYLIISLDSFVTRMMIKTHISVPESQVWNKNHKCGIRVPGECTCQIEAHEVQSSHALLAYSNVSLSISFILIILSFFIVSMMRSKRYYTRILRNEGFIGLD